MQTSISVQRDNHASIPPLSFLQAGCPSCCLTNSVKPLKAKGNFHIASFFKCDISYLWHVARFFCICRASCQYQLWGWLWISSLKRPCYLLLVTCRFMDRQLGVGLSTIHLFCIKLVEKPNLINQFCTPAVCYWWWQCDNECCAGIPCSSSRPLYNVDMKLIYEMFGVPWCLQTKAVHMAMEQKQFEKAVKLRGRLIDAWLN